MPPSRGSVWFAGLTGAAGIVSGAPASIRMADASLGAETARFLAVLPDPEGRFPRARHGEVGLEEAWTLARQVQHTMAADTGRQRRPIIAIVDVSSQAYGRLEEMLGLHLACAAAVEAYATARLAGHPITALLVGKAMSGAFLAHGYQANRMVALDDPGVIVNAMGKTAAARIMRRSVEDLDASILQCPPMAYDIKTYARWGLLHQLVSVADADNPGPADIETVRDALVAATLDARRGPRDLSSRLLDADGRLASIRVRQRLAEQWDDP